MAAGLTRSEQIALVCVGLVIVAGVTFQNCGRSGSSASLDPSDPRWLPAASLKADSPAQPAKFQQRLMRQTELTSGRETPDSASPLDLNSATESDLEALPGIGPVRAQAILQTRAARGGYKSVDDLLDVKGIGEVTLDKLRPFVTVGGGSLTSGSLPAVSHSESPVVVEPPASEASSPAEITKININTADMAELEKIPGVGPALAARIIQARKARLFRSPSDLVDVKGIGPKTFEKMEPWVTVE